MLLTARRAEGPARAPATGYVGGFALKRGTDRLLKFKKLQRALGRSRWEVVGILGTLWDFAADNAPRGDVGRFSNEDIAIGMDYADDADSLVAALVATGWLDASDEHRMVIHDWREHCEDWVHMKLARAGLHFADGAPPRLTKFTGAERQRLSELYGQASRGQDKAADESDEGGSTGQRARRAHDMRTTAAHVPLSLADTNTQANAIANANADTRADTDARTGAQPRARPRPGHAPGTPGSTGSVGSAYSVGSVIGGLLKSPETARMGLVRELVRLQGEPWWADWWDRVTSDYAASGGDLHDFHELVKRVRDAQNPAIRRAKDIGEFTAPGKWLVKNAQKLMQTRHLKWPNWPEHAGETRLRPG